MFGTTGDDTLVGNDANDILHGDVGNDILRGGKGADTLFGEAGDDFLESGTGFDQMVGGEGNDTYQFGSGDIMVEDANGGIDTVLSAVQHVVLPANFEHVTLIGEKALSAHGNDLANLMSGSKLGNFLYGAEADDTIYGYGGNDTLSGGQGGDQLYGGAGDDFLYGFTEADLLVGGAGNDTYFMEVNDDTIVELAGEGTDLVRSGRTYTLGEHLEDLTLIGGDAISGTGNSLNNIITGNNNNNTLLGGKGNDALFGYDGNDVLNGGSGADRMEGGLGNDTYVYGIHDYIVEEEGGGIDTVLSSLPFLTLAPTLERVTLDGEQRISADGNNLDNLMRGNRSENTLRGGDGNDTINGLLGDDAIEGGTGADQLFGSWDRDVFVYSRLADSTVAAFDTICDMTTDDLIDLSLIDANTHVEGDQAFAQVSAFTSHAAEMVLTYDASANQNTLTLDVNGDAQADFKILILGNQLQVSNWIL